MSLSGTGGPDTLCDYFTPKSDHGPSGVSRGLPLSPAVSTSDDVYRQTTGTTRRTNLPRRSSRLPRAGGKDGRRHTGSGHDLVRTDRESLDPTSVTDGSSDPVVRVSPLCTTPRPPVFPTPCAPLTQSRSPRTSPKRVGPHGPSRPVVRSGGKTPSSPDHDPGSTGNRSVTTVCPYPNPHPPPERRVGPSP